MLVPLHDTATLHVATLSSRQDLSKAGTLTDTKVALQMALPYFREKSVVICLEISCMALMKAAIPAYRMARGLEG